MTPGTPPRLAAGAALLVAIWIGVYWVWEPRSATVSFQKVAEPDLDLVDPIADDATVISLDDMLELVQGRTTEANQPVTEQSTALTSPRDVVEHIVRRGETFESLAERYYGDSTLWTVIARENPFTSADRLSPGAVIRVPTGDGVQAEPDKPASIPRETEYVVRSGDSLSTISQTVYGTTRHVNAIFQANRHQLSSPNAIRIGQVLVIPPLDTVQERPNRSSEGQR